MLEQLLFLVLFLLVFLVSSSLVELLKKRQRMAPSERKPESPSTLPKTPLRLPPLRVHPPALHESPRGVSLSEIPVSVTHRRAHAGVGSLREVRRGIVLMTILGPCRALESPRPPQ